METKPLCIYQINRCVCVKNAEVIQHLTEDAGKMGLGILAVSGFSWEHCPSEFVFLFLREDPPPHTLRLRRFIFLSSY